MARVRPSTAPARSSSKTRRSKGLSIQSSSSPSAAAFSTASTNFALSAAPKTTFAPSCRTFSGSSWE